MIYPFFQNRLQIYYKNLEYTRILCKKSNLFVVFADFFSLQCADGGHELVAPVLIGAEEIEGGAAGREQDGVAFVGRFKGRVHGIKQIIGGDNLQFVICDL